MVNRFLRHVFTLPGAVARAFPASSLSTIEEAIAQSERKHGGEIRFAVEAALDPLPLIRNQSPRERALQVFSELGVWDTEQNNGVLLYLLLADHDVEIIADRGFNGRVGAAEWEEVCREMEAALRAGRYEGAVTGAISRLTALVARHFPARPAEPDELPNRPVRV
jgi:uncharacterized membrane protein